MDNVIQILEKLGSSSEIRNNDAELLTLLEEAQVDEAVKAALSERDFDTLATLLHTKFKIYCLLFPSKDDDDTDEDGADDKEEESSDEEKDLEEKTNSKLRVLA